MRSVGRPPGERATHEGGWSVKGPHFLGDRRDEGRADWPQTSLLPQGKEMERAEKTLQYLGTLKTLSVLQTQAPRMRTPRPAGVDGAASPLQAGSSVKSRVPSQSPPACRACSGHSPLQEGRGKSHVALLSEPAWQVSTAWPSRKKPGLQL